MAGDDLQVFLFFLSLAVIFGVEVVRTELTSRRVVFGALAAACFFFGAFWLQIRPIWPALTQDVASVTGNPVAWFVIVMFSLAVFALRPQRQPPQVTLPRSEPGRINAEKPKKPAGKKEKVFIDSTPEYLLGFYKDRARIQGDKLAEAYIGKWMKVTGTVQNIHDNFVSLRVGKGDFPDNLYLNFNEDRKDAFHVLELKKAVTAIGEIRYINPSYVDLYDCELVPTAQPT